MQQVCEEILCIPNCSRRGSDIVNAIAILETGVTGAVRFKELKNQCEDLSEAK